MIAYGPARMGFGLYLPEFRREFDLSDGAAGLIAGLGFAGFLIGLVIAHLVTSRRGARASVLLGLIAACIGIGLIALATDPVMLTAGAFLAMSSAGFCWAPFNRVVQNELPVERRPRALSIISAGTSIGVLAAGTSALWLGTTQLDWRYAWAIFGILALGALAFNFRAVSPGKPRASDRNFDFTTLIGARAMPLYGIALSFGLTTTIYISFAADWITRQGGTGMLSAETAPALLFIVYGAFGLLGIATDRLRTAIGLVPLIRGLLVCSAVSHVLLAQFPDTLAPIIVSAALQGVFVMMMSAVLSFWSERLFPEAPALGFTLVLIALATGSVAGPLASGLISEHYGPAVIFLVVAGFSLATLSAAREKLIGSRDLLPQASG